MEERCAYISESRTLQEQFKNHVQLKEVSLITLDIFRLCRDDNKRCIFI
jgi:hypothetical protein